jgi:GT2 family glycosyltransferase
MTMPAGLQISAVIVNYNAAGFILLTLESLRRALQDINSEIIVVDNASGDGSPAGVQRFFPQVRLIQNSRNLGFAAAGNIGLQQGRGEFIVLLNPDAVLAEDTVAILLDFMNRTPQAGAVGCRILDAGGRYSPDARHSVPSPLTALWKQLGLQRLFPGSRVFGRYNLTYLPADEIYPLDAISGSFMFLRRAALEQVGWLDEDYFMYCEDIDFCYRLNRGGWPVYYNPATTIIHFKGESTARNTIRYSWNFNHSLYLFYKKHFRHKYGPLMSALVLLGILLRIPFIYIKNGIRYLTVRMRDNLNSGRKKTALWAGTVEHLLHWLDRPPVSDYRITGLITAEPTEPDTQPGKIPLVGTLGDIKRILIPPGTKAIIYDTESLSFKTIIQTITGLRRRGLNNKIFLDQPGTLIGKSSR